MKAEDFVPKGKAYAWLGGAALALFMAGYGASTTVGQHATLPDSVGVLSTRVEANTDRLEAVEDSVSGVSSELREIRCLARLTAEGRTMTPLALDEFMRTECR